ncbi:hypothetical protein CTAYLR_009413 [Chrysophaeum taylorii]|uniref:ubiquitinyl hydrolase 1 n=1 Tax=Chrysophaeum taylorii TaxID=2483200 RepID=A0AAD7XP96_9STRA|nr:hypothetical protein CTAYLR_009413 [Chrysophaeum taylorii]
MANKRDASGKKKYRTGQELDVMDTVSKWAEAEVVAVDEASQRILITYTFWSDKWDEWLDFDSDRIRPRGSETYDAKSPKVGQRVEAFDEKDWLEAEIVAVREDAAFVHYKNYHRKFDEWVPLRRVRPFGRSKRVVKQALAAKIAAYEPRLSVFERSLEKRGLGLVRVSGDGNCLFRSVAHQIYGDDKHHALVRQRCLDYMEQERAYFEPYVAMDFASYVAEKRRDGSWGDEPELQALCELYDRPAQVWSYNAGGAKVLRAFHGTDCPPMRLSYYGGGHYDSIVALGRHAPLLSTPPGHVESAKLFPLKASDEEATDAARVSAALAESRRLFDARDVDLEAALKASLEALGEPDDFLPGDDLDELQASLDARAAKAHEDTDLERALELSGREHDDSRLATVLSASTTHADDENLAKALDLSQRDNSRHDDAYDIDLVRAIAASLDQQ